MKNKKKTQTKTTNSSMVTRPIAKCFPIFAYNHSIYDWICLSIPERLIFILLFFYNYKRCPVYRCFKLFKSIEGCYFCSCIWIYNTIYRCILNISKCNRILSGVSFNAGDQRNQYFPYRFLYA